MSLQPALDLPMTDQVEVTLIGPGYGESLVIHLGGGEWAIIDSCVLPGQDRSAALLYLDMLGVDVSTDVKLVVATHWHDDHVRGLSSVVRECTSADFCCSVALQKQEFLALTEISAPLGSRFTSGVKEMAECIQILTQRKRAPLWATSSRRLLLRPNSALPGLWALSPADGDVQRALSEFANAVALSPPAADLSSTWSANHASVVVMLEMTDDSVLLGGDLEHVAALGNGWHGVLGDGGRPTHVSSLFKVAHHGSVTGHCDAVWGDKCQKLRITPPPALLERDTTVSILAPWKNAGRRLPTAEDVDRLQDLSHTLHMTRDVDSAFGDGNELASTMAAVAAHGRHIEPFRPTPGALRCRALARGVWDVQAVAV